MAERHTTIEGDQIDISAMGLGLKKDVNDNIENDLDLTMLQFVGNKVAIKDQGVDTLQLNVNAVNPSILDLAGTYDFAGAGGTIKVVAPVLGSDAATKDYVDTIAQSLKNKFEVRVTSLVNITLSGIQTIDGVLLVAGEQILVQGQTLGVENGIYVVASGAWTRSTTYAVGFKAAASFMFIQEGTVHSDAGYVCTNNASADVVGTAALTFVQFSSAGQIVAGIALDKVGSVLNVKTDGVTVGVNGTDQLEVPASGIGTVQLADNSVTEPKLASFNAPTVGNVMTFTANGLEWINPDVTGIQDTDYIGNEIPAGIKDGVNDTFTLASTPINAQSVSLYLNGVFQAQGVGLDYTIVGATITFINAPNANRDMYATYVRV